MFAEYTDSERGAKRWNLLAVYIKYCHWNLPGNELFKEDVNCTWHTGK